MFVSPSNIKSSSIESLSVSGGLNQAIVKYVGNDKTYLYTGVDFAGLTKLFVSNVESIGQWVNTYCKQDSNVQCHTV